VRRVWRRLSGPDPPSAPAVDTARRQALGLPIWCVFLSCLGWLPGGVLFPLLLGDVSGGVSRHFLISFTIAGLIALTYSYFAMQYVALRVLYPSLWVDPRQAAGARDELRGSKRRLAVFQFLAVLIPLAGAGLLIGTGAEDFDAAGYRTFRVLVTALIVLGMTGLGVAVTVSRRLHETLAALTRTDAGPR
jgi:hypothetical protein